MSATALLEVQGITKKFPGTQALDGVDLLIQPGEIHALIGPNGCGKSTLIKILAGYHQPDDGEIRINGEALPRPYDSAVALDVGLRFLHQDLALIPDLSVTENLALGFGYKSYRRLRPISWRTERSRALTALKPFGMDGLTDCLVRNLSPAERTVVAIARMLSGQQRNDRSHLLVLDEPTAALHQEESETLFNALRTAVASGAGVLYVSHRLAEIPELCDRVSMMRDGRIVASEEAGSFDLDQLVEFIAGRSLKTTQLDTASSSSSVAIRLIHVSTSVLDDVSLEVMKGEVFGITGLVGSGTGDVANVLFDGSSVVSSGQIEIEGTAYESLNPRLAKSLGIGYVPADRHSEGSISEMNVRENLTLPCVDTFFRGMRLRLATEHKVAARSLLKAGVSPCEPERTFATLSGGNQQKVIIERWVRLAPRVLVLNEPMEGIDAGARATIYERIRAEAMAGTAIILISSEWEDLPTICNRIAVLDQGHVKAILKSPSLSTNDIIGCIYGSSEEEDPDGHD